ncbi:MAG: ABC transporter permease subunit [Anaerolineae bacterium]|nr:ABC transporter permease subunit [Anaerolineae bacterium]
MNGIGDAKRERGFCTFARRSEAMWGYLFIAPQILGLVLFILGPVLSAFYLSFTRWNMTSPPEWVGLENYLRQFTNTNFFALLGNTLYLTFGYIPLVVVASLVMALLLNQRLPLTNMYRSVYFLPVVTSIVAISVLWKWLLQPEFGLLNYLLSLVGIKGPLWLSSREWAMPGLILMRVWWGSGYYMVIILAGLQGIPTAYYEAAKIDGANTWQRFRHVTLPLLSPAIFFVIIMAAIWTLQAFDQVYMMTEGGPADATSVMVLQIYRQAFRYFRMGDATALSMILFAIILIFTYLQFRYSKWVHYQ